ARSPGPSRSRRAASSASIVAGSSGAPDSSANASSCSRKSGLPPAAATSLARAPAESARPARSWSASAPASAGRSTSGRRRLSAQDRRPRTGEPLGGEAGGDIGTAAARRDEALDEVEEGRLGPLQVVEHEHERLRLRESLAEAAERPRDLARRGRVLRPERRE